ncbi:MAG: DUF2254 family protein, partial [Polycyclovorans sp.]|nr:DUF2254 family protein [Polycyclovorans sp.]
FAELVSIAQEANVLVVLSFRAGDYLTAQGHQIGLYPAERAGPHFVKKVVQTFTIGAHRTPVQDLEFPIRHLVEIAARALSTGVNDPYTAAAVVDRLSASLSRLMTVGLPAGELRDAAGEVRVICERPTYASLVGAAFDQIRQSGEDKPMVLIHLAQAVARIADAVGVAEQSDVLRTQLKLIGETSERHVENAHDREAVSGRVKKAQEALKEAENRITA